ncbi:hypothetical protein PSTEL_02695 [Paenibacillus stellifer]|uniref:GGDEF domain-containing protein n=1 Tax=Paenibacillus stellifer TaxID=169760 RepID=A0A089LSJ0_9BACL|nr:hypothetical protein [Paenibacillus stellifer]AIQ62188.1 hypothetical protein PSTEL_02695 [Paenibacillus stellifer]
MSFYDFIGHTDRVFVFELLVLITLECSLFGAVSIRRLLLTVADVRAEMGIFMNPLTSLPGNRIIDEGYPNYIQLEQFSVLYIDLDYFKS